MPRTHFTASTLVTLLFILCGPMDAAAQYYSQTNVALGKPVTPSTDTALGAPSNVTDGNWVTSFYSYQGSPSQQVYTIDLGAAYTIGKLLIFIAQARQIEIQSSLDGAAWDSRATFNWGQMVSSPLTLTPDGSYSARYFKYIASNNDGAYVGGTEFAVYPWVAEAPPAATGSNVAQGKPATDYYSPVAGFEAANAVDGDLGTIWKGSYADSRLTYGTMNVDLGAPFEITAIRVRQSAGGGSHAFLVALEDGGTSPGGGTDWIAYGDPALFGTDVVLDGTREFVLPQAATHRFVWVLIYNNLSPTSVPPGMLEIEVLGSAPATPTPTRTPVAKSKCDAGKIQCVAKKQACLLAAHAKAEKKGVQLDGTAVLKCTDKFDGGTQGFVKGCVGKLEDKEDAQKPETLCAVTGDLVALEAKVDAFVIDVVSGIDPGFPALQPPNDCNAGKKACMSRKTSCLLQAQLNAVKRNVPVDDAVVQKCKAKFDGGSTPERGCVAKLEAKQDPDKPKTLCAVPQDDVAALEAKVDAFVADVVSDIRNAP